ncbi:polysaccharide deacetylase family protein [Clostridium sp.]|uniref:polysaccharide deacetylase family protein n=1 Tax=Clostridium sp. TaxID=1506 RepID=UPI00283E17D2|nr:polysaccharide deacetylase family protein [Clostridium sp.]MDR3596303.1 polysaccharide deacetylase [Clostridium sp.]
MKSKLKYILFLVVSVFLIISIFKENICSASEESNIINNKKTTSDEKPTSNGRKIYLTFDDGPSCKITNDILDTLEKNEVKATFFLIGNKIEGKEDVVKKIYSGGNSIGLHSYTHNFNTIYCDEEKFIQEMIDCRNEINKVIGISPNIIRFPGGSYSRFSEKGIKILHDSHLKVYDWNLDTTDGFSPNLSPKELYRKATKGSEKLYNITLLMHCTDMNENTSKALPKIIEYYKSQGYEFATITEDTPELYSRVRKKA